MYIDTEPKPDWLVPFLIHKGHLILLCGEAGAGKSFFSYNLANALATGSHFIDGECLPEKRVLYIDEENARADLGAYARWTWRGLDCPSRDLLRENLRIESRTLGAANSMSWGKVLRDLCAEYKPDLFIIDTATPACHIQDENDNAEAARACQQLRLAQDAAGRDCVGLVLKHLRKDANTGRVDVRGAKHWKGAVDAIWYHKTARGRPWKDGWRNTRIVPEKTRAYGLRDELLIRPALQKDWAVRLEVTRRPHTTAAEDEQTEGQE